MFIPKFRVPRRRPQPKIDIASVLKDRSDVTNPRTRVFRSESAIQNHRGRLNKYVLRQLLQVAEVESIEISAKDREGNPIQIDYDCKRAIHFSNGSVRFSIEAKKYRNTSHLTKIMTADAERKAKVSQFLQGLPQAPPLGPQPDYEDHEKEPGTKELLEQLSVPLRFSYLFRRSYYSTSKLETMGELIDPTNKQTIQVACEGQSILIYTGYYGKIGLLKTETVTQVMQTLHSEYRATTLLGMQMEDDDYYYNKKISIEKTSIELDTLQKILQVKYADVRWLNPTEVTIWIPTDETKPLFFNIDEAWSIILAQSSTLITQDNEDEDD